MFFNLFIYCYCGISDIVSSLIEIRCTGKQINKQGKQLFLSLWLFLQFALKIWHLKCPEQHKNLKLGGIWQDGGTRRRSSLTGPSPVISTEHQHRRPTGLGAKPPTLHSLHPTLHPTHPNNTLEKFAVDATVVGLISEGNRLLIDQQWRCTINKRTLYASQLQ